MSVHYKKITLPTLNKQAVIESEELQWCLANKDTIKPWQLKLIDLHRYDPQFYDAMEQLFREKITVTRLFVTKPHTSTVIHTDAGYQWAINIPIINIDDSITAWWKLRDGAGSILGVKKDAAEVSYAANDGGANLFNVSDIEQMIECTRLQEAVLFDTSVPHNILSDNKQPGLRVVLSVRFKSGRVERFSDAVERLASKLLIKR